MGENRKLGARQEEVPNAAARPATTKMEINEAGTRGSQFNDLPAVIQWSFSRKIFLRFQLARHGRIVKRSGLFSVSYYLSQNPDVAKAGVDPIEHYFLRGAYEGRDPHPFFDSSYYLSQNRDVARTGVNPLAHYLVRGAYEGRNPHPRFDSLYYLSRNPDIAKSHLNPLVHYVMRGQAEGLASHPSDQVLPPTKSNLLNVPGRELLERVVGGYWPETFLISGQETAENITSVLAKIGQSISSFRHILDFGCGCARTARFMIPYGAPEKPVCVDVDEAQINYCQAVLPSLGEYVCIPDAPPMPLDANRFDLIYSISTFTHFRNDFQHHWLRELKRVSAPGGTLILTISGPRNRQHASPQHLEQLQRDGFSFIEGAQRGRHNPTYYHLALHSHEYVRRVWGEYFEILDIVPQIINNNQDAVLCSNTR